jgi:hypothetical protein
MANGDIWRKFFEKRGWIKKDVIAGSGDEVLSISLRCSGAPGNADDYACETALILPDEGLLCHETKTGTVFFQWEDIVTVRVDDKNRRKSWL